MQLSDQRLQAAVCGREVVVRGIDRMRPPMLQAAALAQAHRACQDAAATMRDEIEGVVKAARTAIATDVPTSHGS
jgi:hypothetical protein